MSKKKTLIINLVISALIVFLLFSFAKLNIVELFREIKKTNLFWFSLCTLGFLAQIFTNAYRWNILTNLLNYKLKYLRALRWYFKAMFSNSFIPTNIGGDALRAYLLGKDKRDWLRASGTVIVERIFGLVTMLANIPLGLGFYYIHQDYFKEEVVAIDLPELAILSYRLWGAWHYEFKAVKTLVLLAWVLVAFTLVVILTYKLWSKIPLKTIAKIKYAVEEYTQCHKSLAKVILWTIITHVFLILSNIFAAKALGLGLLEIPWWYWFLLIPAVTFMGAIVPAMKGVGAKEASYVFFLGIIGLSTEKSLGVGLLVFAAMLLSSLPGLFALVDTMKQSKLIETK